MAIDRAAFTATRHSDSGDCLPEGVQKLLSHTGRGVVIREYAAPQLEAAAKQGCRWPRPSSVGRGDRCTVWDVRPEGRQDHMASRRQCAPQHRDVRSCSWRLRRKWRTARSCQRAYWRVGRKLVTSPSIQVTVSAAAPRRSRDWASAAGARSRTVRCVYASRRRSSTSTARTASNVQDGSVGGDAGFLNRLQGAPGMGLVPGELGDIFRLDTIAPSASPILPGIRCYGLRAAHDCGVGAEQPGTRRVSGLQLPLK